VVWKTCTRWAPLFCGKGQRISGLKWPEIYRVWVGKRLPATGGKEMAGRA